MRPADAPDVFWYVALIVLTPALSLVPPWLVRRELRASFSERVGFFGIRSWLAEGLTCSWVAEVRTSRPS